MTHPQSNFLVFLRSRSYPFLTKRPTSHFKDPTSYVVNIDFHICDTNASVDDSTPARTNCCNVPLFYLIGCVLLLALLIVLLMNVSVCIREYHRRLLFWLSKAMGVQNSVFNPYRVETWIPTSPKPPCSSLIQPHNAELDPRDVSRTTLYGKSVRARGGSGVREPWYLTGHIPQY